MRLNSLKSLMSTASLAAFAALAGTAASDRTAWAVDEIITVNSTTQRSLDTDGDDLTVTNGAELAVSTGIAVIMNNNNTSLTVGLTTGTAPNTGPGTVTGEGQSAVLADAFTGLNILVNSNGTLRSDAAATSATIQVLAGAGLTIDNHGVIENLGASAGGNGIRISTDSTVTINNTKLDPGDAPPSISADSAAAILLAGSGTVTGAINNDGVIVTGNQNGYTGGAIRFQGGTTLTGGITNNSGATIQGDAGGKGIEFSGSADINNAGTITQVNGGTEGQAIHYDGDATSTITNSGLIQASATGAASGAIVFDANDDVTGAINNLTGGIIRAIGHNASAISFDDFSSLSGGISNAGTIEVTDVTADGGGVAIRVSDIGGAALSISNNTGGVIQGSGTTRGAIAVGSPDENVLITNNGTITNASSFTDSRAIRVDATTGPAVVTINNQNGLINNTGSGTDAIEITGAANFAINNGLGEFLGAIDGGSGRAIFVDNGIGDITNNSVIINNSALRDTIRTDAMDGSIVNQFFGTIQNTASNGTGVFLNGTLAGGGELDNAGIIRGGTGGDIAFLGTADNGFAIFATGGTSTTIINRDTGAISGSVGIANGTFVIEGGIINGNVLGEGGATVDFDLDAVALETTPGDGGFNPLTSGFGFETNGIYSLQLGASSINVNSGALFVHNDMGAENFLIAANSVMRLDGGVTLTSSTGAPTLVNNGLLFVAGGDTATVVGPVDSNGAGNRLGFGISHPTASTAEYGQLVIPETFPINDNGDLVTDANTLIRIYNDFQGFTPAATGIVLVDANNQLTINGVTNVGGTLANMDTAFNDTLTLQFVAYAGGPDSNDLLLDVIRTPLNSDLFGLTPNQRNAAGALESIGQNNTGSGQMNAFLGLLDSITEEDQLANALEQTLPIANGAALYGSVIAFDSVLQSIDSRLAGLHMGGASNDMGMAAASVAGGTLVSPAADVVEPYAPQSALWFRGGGGSGEQNTQDGPGGPVDGWDGETWYGVVGADAEVSPGLRLGATLAYVDSSFDGDDVNDSRLEIQSYQGSLYGAWESDGWWATGVVGGGMNDYEGKRSIDITTPAGDLSDTKRSDYDGWQITAKAMVGKVIGDATGPNIAPFVSLRYSYIDIEGYDEEGNTDDALSLEVEDQDYEQLLPGFGVRLAAPILTGDATLVPWLRASYQYDVIGDRQVTTSAFGGDLGSPQATFVTEGLRPGRDVLNLGGGLSFFSSDVLSATLSVDWEDREDYESWSGFGELRFAF